MSNQTFTQTLLREYSPGKFRREEIKETAKEWFTKSIRRHLKCRVLHEFKIPLFK